MMAALPRPPALARLPLLGLVTWGGLTLIHFLSSSPGPLHSVPTPARTRGEATPPDRHLLHQAGGRGDNEVVTKAQGGTGEWEEEQGRRRALVARACAGWAGAGKVRPERKSFLYSPDNRLLYCRNAKVGTTTWLSHFLALSPLTAQQRAAVNTSRLLHSIVPGLFRLAQQDLPVSSLAQSTVSFSMVRHPFERLVSAYQDKVVDNSDTSYRHVGEALLREHGEISFPVFVQHVIDTAGKVCPAPPARCRLDVHWRPFYARCAYCSVPYSVIAKAETFADDLQHIGSLAGVAFPEMVTHHSSGDTSELAASYFSQVPVEQVRQLHLLYRPDFDMFGYSPDTYLAVSLANSGAVSTRDSD